MFFQGGAVPHPFYFPVPQERFFVLSRLPVGAFCARKIFPLIPNSLISNRFLQKNLHISKFFRTFAVAKVYHYE